MYGAEAFPLMFDQSWFSMRTTNTAGSVELVVVPNVSVVVVVVGVMTVVVVTQPSPPFALQQERQAVALCLHSDRARMSIWLTRLRHGRPEGPGVQSPRADARSARACVRQSSFCEAQDFLQSRHALSHFVAASICEAWTSGRTGASSVRRGQIRGMAPQPQGPCLCASIIVGYPSGYGGFPYQRNTFAPMAVVTKTVADPSATAVSEGQI